MLYLTTIINLLSKAVVKHDDLYLLLSEKHLRSVVHHVVALNFHPGQDLNNFWPMTEVKMKDLVDLLEQDPNYKTIYKKQYRYIFIKDVESNTR